MSSRFMILSGSKPQSEAWATLFLAMAVVLWGCSPRVIAVAEEHAPPLLLSTLRVLPAAIVLLLALPVMRSRFPSGVRTWLWAAVTGLVMVTAFQWALIEGVAHAGPGNAVVLANTTPFFVLILARVFLGERVAWGAVAGLVVGFIGVILMVWSQLGGEGRGDDLILGMGCALIAAVSWGVGTLLVRQRVIKDPGVDLLGLTAGQFVIGGVALVALTFSLGPERTTNWASGELWLAVAFISVGSTALATLAYFAALKRLTATRASAWLFLAPVVGVLIEIVLGEVPSAVVLIGMTLTIGGVAVVNRAPSTSSPAEAATSGEEERLKMVVAAGCDAER
jgi:drug/metabolite transporter (DMT)-like permease